MKWKALLQILCFSVLFLPRAEAQEDSQATGKPISREERPAQIFISGVVVEESGGSPAGAVIELDCSGMVTKEADVQSSGQFSFALGEGSRFGKQFQDPSQDTADPFLRDSGMGTFDVGSLTTSRVQRLSIDANKLSGCMLRASLSGYKSSTIELGTAPLSTFNNIGTIVLFPAQKIQGHTVSGTGLLAPKSARKAMDKAKVALRKDRIGDSEKHLKSALALYPKYAEAWFLLGKLHQSQRRIREARDAYTEAVKSDNLYVNPLVGLGQISAAEQKWQEAADFSERALTLDPSAFPETYYVNALANFNLHNLEPAEKSALQAERIDSTHRFPKLYLILASAAAERDDWVGAIEGLHKYVRYGPRGTAVLQKYGSAPYLNAGWENAGESLKKEMASSAGVEVRLALAEVFWGAGMADPAKAELDKYLHGRDIKDMPPHVREFAGQIRQRNNDPIVSPASKEVAQTEDRIDYLHYPVSNLPDFEPAGSQATMESILAAVGTNVSTFFAGLLNVSAVESVQLERFGPKGELDPSRTFDYLYLCLGAVKKEDLVIEEYRSNAEGREISQLGLDEGYMMTSRFVSAPLLFHPLHQNGNTFRLLGYQKLRGRNTFVVAYAQIPGKSRLSGIFQFGTNTQETFKQGIAWIDAESFQIIRLVSDLLEPFPRIKLDRLRTQIDFDEVRLDQAKEKLWMPVQVVVNVRWNGKVLRNTHQYSDFRLFDVATSHKITNPTTGTAAPETVTPAK